MVKETYVDEVKIMQQIGAFLVKESEEGVEEKEMVETKEQLLEELQDIVENLDRARDLKCIGGLPILLGLMDSSHPSLRWRAAEVLSACVQNHPQVQEWALESGCLPPLLQMCEDTNSTCVTKALLALTSLVRNFPSGCAALLSSPSLPRLPALCHPSASTTSDARLTTKALRLAGALCVDAPACQKLCNLGILEAALQAASGEERDVREAALSLLLQMMSSLTSLATTQAEQIQRLKDVVEDRLSAIKKLMFEDRQCCLEEEDICVAILDVLASPPTVVPETPSSKAPLLLLK
eukprot:CAMPEP_0196572612 /NCGR_PEP_ID=MMETSP1081-20130531/2622_1 /TAXON_ID=36882 /ORGANISM="Pyramimonas amylifera, Strain CCMP720" /LENGTH=293 /DNA_ID=CAMNT_0041889977 /DNA_START=308 /DNA_END=1189 /DNA_ORIENTATION=-